MNHSSLFSSSKLGKIIFLEQINFFSPLIEENITRGKGIGQTLSLPLPVQWEKINSPFPAKGEHWHPALACTWDCSPCVKQTKLEKAFKLMLSLNNTMLINKIWGLCWWKEKLAFSAPVLNNWTSPANNDLPQDSIRWCGNFHACKWNLICKQKNKLEEKKKR